MKNLVRLLKDSPCRTEALAAIALTLTVLLVYVAYPTRNHYWDGIGFAMTIEDAQGIEATLFNPNHLGYNLFGYWIYHALQTVAPEIRALTILVRVNQLLGALSAMFLFLILGKWMRDICTRLCLALIFAFSANWWKFATDADVYVPSVFCLILIFFMLTKRSGRPKPVWLGLLHACAMLLHQIAIFFYLPAVFGLWKSCRGCDPREKVRGLAGFTAVSGLVVLCSYLWVWFGVIGARNFSGLVPWIISNGRDTYAYSSLLENLVVTIRSNVRLFFGGRFSLALDFVEAPALVVLGTLLIASVCFFLVHLVRSMGAVKEDIVRTEPDLWERLDSTMLCIWTGSFGIFLFFWLTEYPYYRMFYLPAFIGLVGSVIARYRPTPRMDHSYALAGFAAIVFLINFTFLIYPYSKPGATPPVDLALNAKRVWDKDSVVFYRKLTTDNWTFRYFNRQTKWRKVNVDSLRFQADICELNRAGYKTWVDVTASDYLREQPEVWDWLERRGSLNVRYGLSDRKHRIYFVRVRPDCENYALETAEAMAEEPTPEGDAQ